MKPIVERKTSIGGELEIDCVHAWFELFVASMYGKF